MSNKKNHKRDDDEEVVEKKKVTRESDDDEVVGDEPSIDTAILEDTFTEEFSEYNDVDNF